jgi:hypothetical protein
MAGKPLVIAALGSRGSGKSAWVKQQIERARPARLVVWDFMREYGELAEPVQDVGAAIRAMQGKAWRIAVQPDPAKAAQHFDLVCRAVKAARRCTFVAEELAFVTTPSKAPPAWRELCLLGRHATHAECSIYGVSQRPASIDKDFLACCDVIHAGRLAYGPDAQAVAPFIGCDWRELSRLADLSWIEKHAGRPDLNRGVLSFGNVTEKKSRTRSSAAAPSLGTPPKDANLPGRLTRSKVASVA